jgi:hypothetical protein
MIAVLLVGGQGVGRWPRRRPASGDPVRLAVEHEFVGGGSEPVDGGLGEQRIGHESEPLERLMVGGGHRRRGSVVFDNEFVDVGGVEYVEGLEREVVDDEQVDAQQLAHLDVVAVVEP